MSIIEIFLCWLHSSSLVFIRTFQKTRFRSCCRRRIQGVTWFYQKKMFCYYPKFWVFRDLWCKTESLNDPGTQENMIDDRLIKNFTILASQRKRAIKTEQKAGIIIKSVSISYLNNQYISGQTRLEHVIGKHPKRDHQQSFF